MIKVKNGTVELKTYTRKMARIIDSIMYEGQNVEAGTGAMTPIPMKNLLAVQEKALQLLFDKAIIDGKEYISYSDLEKLEDQGKFTLEDWNDCEEATLTIVNKANLLKKKSVK